MIVSASRRTDIPARYPQWLQNRLQEGFALVRNPMNPRQISRVDLRPEAVDGLVLWTKNPIPLMDKLSCLDPYMYYFQFTITPYDRDIEPNLPEKSRLIEAFQELSRLLGPARVIWRYDPILLNPRYTLEFHLSAFDRMAALLAPYTEVCVFSFLDSYRCMSKAARSAQIQWPSPDLQDAMARELSLIAQRHKLPLRTCAEALDLRRYGISPARCVDGELLSRLLGRPLSAPPAKSPRAACGCAQSVDIGAYSSCPNRCLYCYANHSQSAIDAASALHDPNSPLLIGRPDHSPSLPQEESQLRLNI